MNIFENWKNGLALHSIAIQPPTSDFSGWLAEQVRRTGRGGMILHGTADDGVLWGRWNGERMVMASEASAFGAVLRQETLQFLRVFGRENELRVWRTQTGLTAAWVSEISAENGAAFDRIYALLGANRKGTKKFEAHGVAFSELRGLAGEIHAPPLAGADEARILVRHYFQSDPRNGSWILSNTRWIDLEGS